jgi:hypothetical protein
MTYTELLVVISWILKIDFSKVHLMIFLPILKHELGKLRSTVCATLLAGDGAYNLNMNNKECGPCGRSTQLNTYIWVVYAKLVVKNEQQKDMC